MEVSRRTQNALVAGLAAVAVGLSGYAVWSVNRPSTGGAPLPGAGGATTTTPGDEDEGGSSTLGPDDTVTAAPGTDEASPASEDSEGTTSDGREASVQDWVDAWSEEADLLIVGDGYSNLPSQWVQLWGAQVAADRPVTIRHWGEAEDVTFNDPIVLSETDGPQLTMWNASREGTTVADAAERIDRFVEEAGGEVDAVLVSLGMDSGGEEIAASLDGLITALDGVDDGVPVLVAIGPPGLYEPGVADGVTAWSEEKDDRVALLEVGPAASENPTAEEWAVAFQQLLDDR